MTDMTIRTTVDIEASAAKAWSLFGEGFGDWADWAPGIDRSTLEGPLARGVVRVNDTASLGTVRQELARFDRDDLALAYEMSENLPPFFVKMRNDWVIEEVDAGRCRLTGVALFVLKDEAEPMRSKLEGKMGMALEAFARAFREHVQA
jgi:hypothetical protein